MSGADVGLELISLPAWTHRRVPPLLFIHGGFHGAWCWTDHFMPWFADQGFSCHAVSLRDHGASHRTGAHNGWRLADYVEDVRWAVDQLDQRPILVGHSLGGTIAQKIAFGQAQRRRPRNRSPASVRVNTHDRSITGPRPASVFGYEPQNHLQHLTGARLASADIIVNNTHIPRLWVLALGIMLLPYVPLLLFAAFRLFAWLVTTMVVLDWGFVAVAIVYSFLNTTIIDSIGWLLIGIPTSLVALFALLQQRALSHRSVAP